MARSIRTARHLSPSPARRRLLACGAGLAAALTCRGTTGAAPAAELEAEPGWSSDAVQRIGGLAFGDGDGDGQLDLAAGSYAGGSAEAPLVTQIFLGDGAGLETAPSWASDDERHTTQLAWLLFEGSDRPALLAVNGGSAGDPAVLYRPDGGGLETTPSWVSVPLVDEADRPASGLDAAVGDADGDGRLDLFISNQCYVPCSAVPAAGFLSAGAALAEQPGWQTDAANQYGGIALGDLDRSSVAARAHEATGDGAARVFWLPGAPVVALHRVLVDGAPAGPLSWDPRGGYVALAEPPASGSTIQFLYETASAPDLVLSTRPGANPYPGGVFIHPNDGEGPSTAAADMRSSTEDRYKVLALVDLDRDGYPELVAGGTGAAPLAVWGNDGGALSAEPTWTPSDVDQDVEDMVIADINGDGFPDVAVVEFTGSPSARVYVNHEGELEREPSWSLPYIGESISSVGAGDVNGDAMPDLVLGLAGAPMRIYHNLGAPPAAPSVDAVTPAELAGGEAVELTITGGDFRAPVRVYAGDTLLEGAAVDGDGTIRVTAPAELTDGTYDLIVVNPDVQAAVLAGALVVGDGGEGPVDPVVDEGGGCGCRAGGSPGSPLVLVAAALLLVRRRRR
ncbi:MAG TPA: VCBS repeat-containing protein [Kofleriaceae bacterium]|nr:VCBS repeat-containing protein [Kofleriaceae bacterium]